MSRRKRSNSRRQCPICNGRGVVLSLYLEQVDECEVCLGNGYVSPEIAASLNADFYEDQNTGYAWYVENDLNVIKAGRLLHWGTKICRVIQSSFLNRDECLTLGFEYMWWVSYNNEEFLVPEKELAL